MNHIELLPYSTDMPLLWHVSSSSSVPRQHNQIHNENSTLLEGHRALMPCKCHGCYEGKPMKF